MKAIILTETEVEVLKKLKAETCAIPTDMTTRQLSLALNHHIGLLESWCDSVLTRGQA